MKESSKPQTGRSRAEQLYPTLPALCENCFKVPPVDRHHKDGDTFNNERSNILLVCRDCHMILDGRIKRRDPENWDSCSICERKEQYLRKSRCGRCDAYFRSNGVERPIDYKKNGSPTPILTKEQYDSLFKK